VNRASFLKGALGAVVGAVTLPTQAIAHTEISFVPEKLAELYSKAAKQDSAYQHGMWVGTGDHAAWLNFDLGRITFEAPWGAEREDVVAIGWTAEEGE
jgi:hypothetical protein